MKHVIVGTAGHIDHGKTALVKALTGVDCDRWEEEKRRGITIDIGFAGLDLDADTHLAFIDVPGHERFVKNMLAGAHGIDLLILVVAADESIMPQTREHFEITKLLGIKAGLTVVTKSDLVGTDMRQVVVEELRTFLKKSFLADQPVLCVSAKTGDGLDELKKELKRLAAEIPQKSSKEYFRLPIDRAFSIKGFGTVVTGTLISGQVSKEDEVDLLPQCKRVRVRGVQVHNQSVDTAFAGQRTAINLQGVEVVELARGMVLGRCKTFQPTSRLDVELALIESAPAPLKNHDRVHFHHETSEMVCTVHLLDRAALKPGERGFAQLALTTPTIAQPQDRFVIRRLSPMVTIGGGIILDPLPRKHDRLDPLAENFLKAARNGDWPETLQYLVSESGSKGITIEDLVVRTGLRQEVLQDRLKSLVDQYKIHFLPTRILSTAQLRKLSNQMAALVKEHHIRSPLAIGISKQELKERLGAKVSVEVFEFLLADLVQKKILGISRDLVHAAGRIVALSSEEDTGKKIILEAFRSAGLAVPPVDEVLARLKIDRARAKQIVQLLVREGALVRVTTDLMFHADSIRELRGRLSALKVKSPRISVGEFKEMTGISRKYAIPLLEFLDRERVTRRDGDARVIL
jgi:selenocysteine-specific elongation factor